MKKFIITILAILLLAGLGCGSFYVTYKYKLAQKIEEGPKEVVMKIYYVEDFNKSPISLTYYTKKMDNQSPQADQAKILLTALMRGHENGYSPMPIYTEVKNVSFDAEEKLLTVDFNEEFAAMQPQIDKIRKVNIDCIVNTLVQIKKVDNVQIKVNGNVVKDFAKEVDISKPLIGNIKNYDIVEMQEEKIAKHIDNMLYTNESKVLKYKSTPTTWGAKQMQVKENNVTETEHKVTYNVVSKSTDRSIVLPKKYTQEWVAKKDGLYINEQKVLDRNLYVGSTWTVDAYSPLLNSSKKLKTYAAAMEVKGLNYIEEDDKIIKEYIVDIVVKDMVTKNKSTYTETVYFREGIGIYKKELMNPNVTTFSRLEYQVED